MTKEKFRLLISSKNFNIEVHYELLRIVDSEMVIEELLDLIETLQGDSYD